MDDTLRGLGTADIPEWNRLLAAIEQADRTGEHYNEADLAEEMTNPEVEPGKDILGAFEGQEMVGYFSVYARTAVGALHKIHLDGGVHPDARGRGIGTTLATAMRSRASDADQERHPDMPALLTLTGPSDNAGQAALMKDIGLMPERWSFAMRADLSGPLGTPGMVPEGLELRRYDGSLAEAVLAAHNAAFLDHPNFTPWSETCGGSGSPRAAASAPSSASSWSTRRGPGRWSPTSRPASTTPTSRPPGGARPYVGKIGTRRGYRGRGLASTLLAHALHEYRNAGFDQAALDVDSENPTGALGIYERAGFEVTTRFTDYVARMPAGGP